MQRLAAFTNSQHARHAQSVLENQCIPSTVINQVLDGAQQEYALLVEGDFHKDAAKTIKAQQVPHLSDALLNNKSLFLNKPIVIKGFFFVVMAVTSYILIL